MDVIKGFFGLASKLPVPLAGSANIPPAAVNVPNKKTVSPPVNKTIEKVNALKPAGVKMPNAPVSPNSSANALAPAAAPAAGGTLSDFIGGARRRKNLRKKYKMPGRRAATRKSRKAGSRKARRSTTRKNRRASRKNRK